MIHCDHVLCLVLVLKEQLELRQHGQILLHQPLGRVELQQCWHSGDIVWGVSERMCLVLPATRIASFKNTDAAIIEEHCDGNIIIAARKYAKSKSSCNKQHRLSSFFSTKMKKYFKLRHEHKNLTLETSNDIIMINDKLVILFFSIQPTINNEKRWLSRIII